jgi:hypothetical protein
MRLRLAVQAPAQVMRMNASRLMNKQTPHPKAANKEGAARIAPNQLLENDYGFRIAAASSVVVHNGTGFA